MAFPAPPFTFPGKDEVADYLEAYAAGFELPVRTGVHVRHVSQNGGGYVIDCGEHTIEAENVVVATGTFGRPYTPSFADELDSAIVQLHSSAYKNPSQLREGGVLVVGAAHSGGDIALEVASQHRTVLSGPDTGQIPIDIEGRASRAIQPLLSFVARRVLTIRTPIGRKARPHIRFHGGPLLRVKRADLAAAGVERVLARTAGARDGRPVLDDGMVLDVANVIWCTGFRHDFRWIRTPVVGEDGWPLEERGVVPSAPGLFFVGLAFQYAFSSMLLLGVGRDAEYIANQIAPREHKRPTVGSVDTRFAPKDKRAVAMNRVDRIAQR
jgi:putative flavoprotein involved in K+ transport